MKAIDYIRKGWARGSQARTKTGKPCDARSASAAKWCAIGAILAAYSADALDKMEMLRRAIQRKSLAEWNDSSERTKSEVLAAFRKAGI